MGIDTTTASDHPSTNALDAIDTGESDIIFAFGSRTIKLDRVPSMDDVFIMVLQVKVKGDGNKRNAKGELVPRRDLTIISGWEPGKKHLAEDQAGLFDTDGKRVISETDGDDEDDSDEVDTGDDDQDDDSNVVSFSDGDAK
jgi:hypothetical protein